jgi:hypothetical protein
MLLSVSNVLIMSEHSKHSRKVCLLLQNRLLISGSVAAVFGPKDHSRSFEIQITSMKLIDTGLSNTNYTFKLMKESKFCRADSRGQLKCEKLFRILCVGDR